MTAHGMNGQDVPQMNTLSKNERVLQEMKMALIKYYNRTSYHLQILGLD